VTVAGTPGSQPPRQRFNLSARPEPRCFQLACSPAITAVRSCWRIEDTDKERSKRNSPPTSSNALLPLARPGPGTASRLDARRRADRTHPRRIAGSCSPAATPTACFMERGGNSSRCARSRRTSTQPPATTIAHRDLTLPAGSLCRRRPRGGSVSASTTRPDRLE